MTPNSDKVKAVTAEDRADYIVRVLQEGHGSWKEDERFIADQIKQAEEAARAEGYSEGLTMHQQKCDEKAGSLMRRGYLEGFSDCQGKAAKIAARYATVERVTGTCDCLEKIRALRPGGETK